MWGKADDHLMDTYQFELGGDNESYHQKSTSFVYFYSLSMLPVVIIWRENLEMMIIMSTDLFHNFQTKCVSIHITLTLTAVPYPPVPPNVYWKLQMTHCYRKTLVFLMRI